MNLKQAQSKLNSLESKCQEIVDYYLYNYNKYNDDYRLIVALNPHLSQDIEYMDYERERGRMRSHLHGLPFIVADTIMTKGLPTTAGLKKFENNMAEESASIIKSLKKNGLVFLGKTNTFDMLNNKYTSEESLYLEPVNPFSDEKMNATAMSVFLDIAPVGIDINSSLIKSANELNLSALKTTNSLVSSKGILDDTRAVSIVGNATLDLAFILNLIVSDKKKKEIYKTDHSYVEDMLGFPNELIIASAFKDTEALKRIGLSIMNLSNPNKERLNKFLTEASNYSLDDFLINLCVDILIFDEYTPLFEGMTNPVVTLTVNDGFINRGLFIVGKNNHEHELIKLAEYIEDMLEPKVRKIIEE